MSTNRQQHKEMKQRLKTLEDRPPVTGKEVLLLSLVGLVAALALYTSNDASTSFGLLNHPAVASQLPVITSFREQVLVERPVLELNVVQQPDAATQVSARLFDPTVPPPVEHLTALNTRIGGEVALFWELPPWITQVNVYRNAGDAEELIAQHLEAETYIDTEVTNGETYTYRVASVTEEGGTEYLTANAPTATVTPADVIPPMPPLAVTAVTSHESGGAGVLVSWTNPTDPDFDQVVLYRSEQFGRRGDRIGTVAADDPARFLDENATPNVQYFYTVIAVDRSGNESGGDLGIPPAGNAQPFTPFESVEE